VVRSYLKNQKRCSEFQLKVGSWSAKNQLKLELRTLESILSEFLVIGGNEFVKIRHLTWQFFTVYLSLFDSAKTFILRLENIETL